LPELQNMPQAPTSAELRFETVASDVTVARRSSRKETQEMLDFCAEHITADVEVIPIQKINEAYERMLRSDVKYRFSIDMSSLSRAA
jgi:D-arabinose 1-dehydrogenase-like Zn-dependent alcohol dehydrogenase